MIVVIQLPDDKDLNLGVLPNIPYRIGENVIISDQKYVVEHIDHNLSTTKDSNFGNFPEVIHMMTTIVLAFEHGPGWTV